MGLITRHLLTDEPLPRCPVRTLQLAHDEHPALAAEYARYAQVYYPQWRKSGELPERVGVANQSARAFDILGLFQDIEGRVEHKLLEITKQRTSSTE
jgi:hypothetical protein